MLCSVSLVFVVGYISGIRLCTRGPPLNVPVLAVVASGDVSPAEPVRPSQGEPWLWNVTAGLWASHPQLQSSAIPLTSTELQHSWFSVTWGLNWAYILLTGLFSSSFPYAVSMPVTGASWNWQETQKALFSKSLDLKDIERMLQQAS